MFRRIQVLALVGLIAVLSVSATHAMTLTFDTPLGLTGSQEVPPSASPGSGMGTVGYDDFARSLDVHVSWSDLLAPATVAHIHVGSGPGTNGGVAIPFVGFPALSSGAYDHTFDLSDPGSYSAGFLNSAGGTVDGAETALIDALLAGNAYFNIHTSLYPAGEIRGDIARTPPPIPEPTTLLLLGFGIAAVIAYRRFA